MEMAVRKPRRQMRTTQELREWLLAKRQELLAKLRMEMRGQESPRTSDLLAQTHDQELEYTMVDQRAHMLDQIDRALRKLEEGTYGRCEVCDGVIHPVRRQAQPFALRCTPCQEAWERAEAYSSPQESEDDHRNGERDER